MHDSPRLRALLVLTGLMMAAPLSAQTFRTVQVPPVIVRDPQPVRFRFNDTLAVRLDATSSDLSGRIQARVFTGTKRDVLGQRPGRDGCVEFFTRVYNVTSGIGSSVQVARLDQNWLEPTGQRSFGDGHWVVVFEESGFSDVVLRLDKDDLSKYFAHAVDITVRQSGYTPGDVPAAVADVIANRQSGYTPVAAPRPCDRVREQAGTVALLVEACEPPARRNWLARIFAGG